MQDQTAEIVIGTITTTKGQRQRLTRVGDKIRTTPIDKRGYRRDGFRHDYTPAQILESVSKGCSMTIDNEAEAIAAGLVITPAAPAAMPRLDGLNERILQAIECAAEGTDRITWDGIVTAVNQITKIPKGGWMKVRGVLQYMLDHGRLIRDSDILQASETYFTDVATAKRTALLFASYAYIDNLSGAFPKAKIVQFQADRPDWYALELDGKILTSAAGIFQPRAALLPVRWPEV